MLAFTLLLGASSSANTLTLDDAIEILKRENLEIRTATLDVNVANEDAKSASGMHWGALNFTQDFARSNDAGNVFGFKLASREAAFGDFGFNQFIGQMDTITPGSPTFDGGTKLLATQPNDLNYPDDRNFFQSKLKYQVPLFTGFAITSYEEVMDSMKKLKSLEKEQITQEKIYELKKSYYDMALLNDSISHLEKIQTNIQKLEDVTTQMINEGYAKKIDLLEVQAKKGNVERILLQMCANEKLLYHYISFLLNQKVDSIALIDSNIEVPNYDEAEILNNNLDVLKAKTGMDIHKNMLSASEAALYPNLGAFAEVSTADDSFLGEADDHKAYTLGARLSWNLFNGGIDAAKIEKSKLEQLKMSSQLELARKGVALEISKTTTEIKSINEEIHSLEKELTLMEAIYDNYLGRYKEKLASMSDVIIKQSEEIEKRLELQMAKNKRNEKIFALEKLANGEYK